MLPLYRRIIRILCGRRLPQTWNTVLVLLSVHMYLTVPIIFVAGISGEIRGLLRPYRQILERRIWIADLEDDLLAVLEE